MSTPHPAAAHFRWSPPRTDLTPVGRRWRDWQARARHLLGHMERDLVADSLAVETEVESVRGLSDAELDVRLAALHALMRTRARRIRGRDVVAFRRHRVEALAAVCVAAERTLHQAPYRVQMLAALAMHEPCIAQMAAGEGKTLAVGLAGVLHGWGGLPCHIVTANDYLAERDVELMGPLYRRCGLSVTAVTGETAHDQLAGRYAHDVVYGTGKQLLADFLRDQIILRGAVDPLRRRLDVLRRSGGGREPVMRGLHAAIVDEADSVLIDEANTPLIISLPEPNPLLVEAVTQACRLVEAFEAEVDYVIDPYFRDVAFTARGESRLVALTGHLPAVWHAPQRREDLIKQAITARDLFIRDRHYIVDDGKVVIVDENTGRAMPGRTWSYGLHQAIEAREGVDITHPARTLERMSFQAFYRLYHHLSGGSGTLQGIHGELWKTYGVHTIRVPTRVPSRLRVPPFRHFGDAAEKWQALLETIVALHRERRAVLVGTRRLSDSERLETALRARGLDCAVLNAKQHATEAQIIAEAGQAGRITVATNMAGRGTDIHLGDEVHALGGLHVLMLEPHESARVDWQLFGRAGRQGSPGFAQGFVSLEDDLITRHLPFLARPLTWLARRRPTLRPRLIVPVLWLSQHNAQWRAWRQRQMLQARERLLKKQLSFSKEHEAVSAARHEGGKARGVPAAGARVPSDDVGYRSPSTPHSRSA